MPGFGRSSEKAGLVGPRAAEGLLQAAGDPVGGGRPGVSDWPGASILIPQVLAFLLNEASFPHMPPSKRFSCKFKKEQFKNLALINLGVAESFNTMWSPNYFLFFLDIQVS